MYRHGVLLAVNIFRIGFRTMNSTSSFSAVRNTNATAVFIGDSLTQWFSRKVWDKYYGRPLICKNFGVAGDVTKQTINRLNSGILDGLATAKVSVILIGTNDIGWGRDEVYVANQIEKIVSLVRILLPGVKVLLLGILPRASLFLISDKSIKVNVMISKLDDGNEIRFLDMGSRFRNKDGKVANELYTDGLHLSEEGYLAWAETMAPLFDQMIKP